MRQVRPTPANVKEDCCIDILGSTQLKFDVKVQLQDLPFPTPPSATSSTATALAHLPLPARRSNGTQQRKRRPRAPLPHSHSLTLIPPSPFSLFVTFSFSYSFSPSPPAESSDRLAGRLVRLHVRSFVDLRSRPPRPLLSAWCLSLHLKVPASQPAALRARPRPASPACN